MSASKARSLLRAAPNIEVMYLNFERVTYAYRYLNSLTNTVISMNTGAACS